MSDDVFLTFVQFFMNIVFIKKPTKGHNYFDNVGEVTVLGLCTLSNDALRLY